MTMIVENPNGGFDVMFLEIAETHHETDDLTVHADFLNEAWSYVEFQKDLERQLIENLSRI